MKKVYVVNMYTHDIDIEIEIDGPHISESMVAVFATAEAAEKWADENFISYARTINGFIDFSVVEQPFYDDYEEEESYSENGPGLLISAYLDKNFNLVKIIDIVKYDKDDVRIFYFAHAAKKYYISIKLPSDIKTRKEVEAYLKNIANIARKKQ